MSADDQQWAEDLAALNYESQSAQHPPSRGLPKWHRLSRQEQAWWIAGTMKFLLDMSEVMDKHFPSIEVESEADKLDRLGKEAADQLKTDLDL